MTAESVASRPTTADILRARPPRNTLDPMVPYAFLVEPERSAAGLIEDVATLFLTNRECPFHCLMCDLWKNTLQQTVPPGAIPAQIDFALSRLPPASHIKLYNSGNFFDPRAIPPADYPAIVDRVRGFRSVIVENHPRLCGPLVADFHQRLRAAGPELEIAMGLETIHPQVLPRLNKQMTTDDFATTAAQLRDAGIRLRSFILLKPPGLSDAEGVDWALRSAEFAFDHGASCCAIIPTRGGNGIMEQLAAAGAYSPPRLESLEEILERGLEIARLRMTARPGPVPLRVFVDLWDARRFARCPNCVEPRLARMQRMNLTQQTEPPVACACGSTRSGRE